MKAIDRLYKYLDYKKIKPTRFEKEIGLSNGYLGTQLKRNADLGESIFNKIIDYCLDISPEWLLFGKGSMLKPPGLMTEAEIQQHDKEVAEGKWHTSPAIAEDLNKKEKTTKNTMTADERIDALIRQNDVLSEANITLTKAVQDAIKTSQETAKASQEAVKASQDAIKMAHDTIATNQRQSETNQEIMKQLLSILENSKKNLRAVGVPGAVATRTAHG